MTERPAAYAASGLETLLERQLTIAGYGDFRREHRFAPPRRWRFDLAYVDRRIAVEVEGGTYLAGGGRHQRPGGFESDCLKYNEAALLGWTVIRVTGEMVRDGRALRLVERAMDGGKE